MVPGVAEKLAAAEAPEQQEATAVKPVDLGAIAADVNDFFTRKREERRPYEQTWYWNAASLNGKTNVTFSPTLNGLQKTATPPHRRNVNINIIATKFAAKLAKMTNSRPRPIVVAANQEYQEILNARMSQQALLYASRKGKWDEKDALAVAAAEITGKSFLWIYWDPNAPATFKDPRTGKPYDTTGEHAGDVKLEVGSAFELLVEDLGEVRLGRQASIMRVSAILIEQARKDYPQLAEAELKSDVSDDDIFQFERQIADLGTAARGANGAPIGGRSYDQVKGESKNYILKKERFWAPSADYPMGRYAVVIGKNTVRYQTELPFGFHDLENPYPVEEVYGELTPGRFWPQTMIERMRPAAEVLDTIVSKLMEDIDLSMHGKWLIPIAARVSKASFNSEPGEKIYYNYFPGMPPPQLIQPRGVTSDAWRMLEWARNTLDDVTNLWPSSMGASGGATSGFQTNLLQEANDAVFGPHKRRHERTWEGILFKARRLMKAGYTVDRLVSITSKSQIPAVFEFHQSMIDEHAEIKVEIGSALSDLKATRLQQVQELRMSGLFGNADSPQTKRAILSLVDLGGVEESVDPTYDDTNRALLENMRIGKGEVIEPPAPWQTDAIHVEIHFHAMNSPEFDAWTPEQKAGMMEHVVLHLRRHNPAMGLEIAQMLVGVMPGPRSDELVNELFNIVNQQAMAAPAPEGAEGAPQGPPAPSQPAQQPAA
jgi:hypothetical protein